MGNKAQILKDWIEREGRRQNWVAAQVGCSPQWLNYVIRGKKLLSDKLAHALHTKLGVPLLEDSRAACTRITARTPSKAQKPVQT